MRKYVASLFGWRVWRLLWDTSACVLALPAAILGSTDATFGIGHWTRWECVSIALYVLASVGALFVAHADRMVWRYTNFANIMALLRATMLGVLALVLAEAVRLGSGRISLVFFTQLWVFALVFLLVPRIIARGLAERRIRVGAPQGTLGTRPSRTPIVLVGEPARIEVFLRELGQTPVPAFRVLGIFTSEKGLIGSHLHSVPVIGEIAALPDALTAINWNGVDPQRLVLAKDYPSSAEVEMIMEAAEASGLTTGRLPPLGSLEDAHAVVQPIELSDLLGRPEVPIDLDSVRSLIAGRRVLITGAGGSIGSELSRQIASLEPATLILTDASEFNLYSIDHEMGEKWPRIDRRAVLLDVRDAPLVSSWIGRAKPHIVFHAAALKHVPLVEMNCLEGIKTNVVGTANVANAARTHQVQAMVIISTDKAVNPHNVMGATKRLAEAYCQGMDQASLEASNTRFVTVRFGNVLGSAGSVVPLFRRQLEAGGPLTVTHPDVMRYFMTIPEAVKLVLQAGAHGVDAEEDRGSIYVLDMGKPIKILALARQMIRLSGKRPDIDVKIDVIGLRPGEKLFEEYVHSEEPIELTNTKGIFKARPRRTDLRIIKQQVQELQIASYAGDLERAQRLLHLAVPEYASFSGAPQAFVNTV
jgi:O-antigen biosynthesis protein WbqV